MDVAMAFAKDLLAQSFLLLNKETKNPKQASLRRAVSTAYYAVFHLFIQEGCANWNAIAVRENLARAFSDQTMYKACTAAENAPYPLPIQPAVASKLRSIARAFRELQEQRHLADYSNATKWDRIKAAAKVNQAKTAFGDWKSIRKEHVAQRFLISLLSNYKEP
jgi:hypothetical protein